MKIWNLMENTPFGDGCIAEHGLSFYIETAKHKLLVDTGASGAFLENAQRLGLDLTKVDTVVLSHGHYDHSGGILAFAKENPEARIYIRANAFEDYYHARGHELEYIGIDKAIKGLAQVVVVGGNLKIDEELYLFTNVTEKRETSEGNKELKVVKNGELIQDDFSHEQYLILTCEGKEILLSGCAHKGILNILDRYIELKGHEPDILLSGFHMMQSGDYTEEDIEKIRETARELKKLKTKFYTGHCTGEKPYEIMKEILGDQIDYVRSGSEVKI